MIWGSGCHWHWRAAQILGLNGLKGTRDTSGFRGPLTPITAEKYKVTGDTRVIPIAEHKEDETQWAFNVSFSMDTG